MKKVVAFLLLGLFIAFGYSVKTQAADGDLIDLYPYDQIACLEGTSACTQTKLGSSFWTFEYAGYRYHFVRGAARFASEFNDGNSDGFIASNEMGTLAWNAFAGVIFNNTSEEVVLSTATARTDLTSVVHRIYAYFDENGDLAMVEDHFFSQYIKNEGTTEAPDWRLATAEEKTAYDAADPKPADMLVTPVRMIVDDVDDEGYVLEPLVYLAWRMYGTAADAPIEDRSLLIDGNPDYVTIPADWTVVTFGTYDRGAYTATNFVKMLPGLLADDTVEPIEFNYVTQAPVFNNALGAMDDDPATTGINVVVGYQDDYDLPNDISVSWIDMFDDTTGAIINNTEKLDYEVEISQDGVILETIDFIYDSVNDVYTPSSNVTSIDSSKFGDGYKAIYRATNPEMQVTEREVDIVIGVMPPKYIGVGNRYIDEGMFVDLLEGIVADDGYGNDISNLIEVTKPVGLNVYNPKPGTYTIDLEFTHHVHFDGVDPQPTINVNGTDITWDMLLNLPNAINAYGDYMVYTNSTVFQAAVTGYGSVMVVVGDDGKVKEWYDRYNWNHMTSTGIVTESEALFNAWKSAFQIPEGGFVLAAHGSVKTPPIRNLAYDAPVTAVLGTPDEDYYITKTASYMLTVDDTTAPIALIVDDNYTINTGEFTNKDAAILANVVVFDYYDSIDDLAVYVSNNGNLNLNAGGTYTVEVTVEDMAGNATVVTFDVHVVLNEEVADLLSQLEEAQQALADLEDQFGDDEAALAAAIARIEALETALADAQEAIEALQVVPETGCGSAINGSSALFITFSILMGSALIVFLKKRS